MKNLFTIFIAIFIFSCSYLFSQQLEEVVYLKNGSIIHGTIIEEIPNVSIKIQTYDGNVFVYRMEEIEKITKEPSKQYSSTLGSTNYNFSEYNNGVFSLLRIGFMTLGSYSMGNSNGSTQEAIFAIGSITGIGFGDIYRLGFGIEYNNYPNGTMIPLFIDFRVRVLKSQVSPIFFLDAGYSLSWINDLDGMNGDGPFLNVGWGIEFLVTNYNVLFLEVSYRKQWSQIFKFDYYFQDYSETNDESFNYMTFMVGFSF